MSHARSEDKEFMALAPDACGTVRALGQAAAKAGIDKSLLELIKLRASSRCARDRSQRASAARLFYAAIEPLDDFLRAAIRAASRIAAS